MSGNNNGAGLPQTLTFETMNVDTSISSAVLAGMRTRSPTDTAMYDRRNRTRTALLEAVHRRLERSGKGATGKLSSPRAKNAVVKKTNFKHSKAAKDDRRGLLKLALQNSRLHKPSINSHMHDASELNLNEVTNIPNNVRRTHKPTIESHVHVASELSLNEKTCPLCLMGVALQIDNDINLKDAEPLSPNHAYRTGSLTDALPSCSDAHRDMSNGPQPLPLEQLSTTTLYGGPMGHHTLATTATCKKCTYALDAFAEIGGYQSMIVADPTGTSCYHYFCAATTLPGIVAQDWQQLTIALASRGMFMYQIY